MQDRIDHIIVRYLSGESDIREDKELLKWLKMSDENSRMFFEMKILWNAKYGTNADEKALLKVSMTRMREKIENYEKKRKRDALRRNLLRTGVVAALLSGLVLWLTVFQKSPSPVLLTYSNIMTDSIMQIILEDETIVWLNENTTLKLLDFSDKHRTVELNGCAFFDVAPNAKRPFIVQNGNYRVRVLGTSFGVNTRYEGEQYETVLLEGSVRIERGEKEELATLIPGQQALYSDERSTLNINNIDAKKHTLWRFGIVSLTDASLSEILEQIESVYHVKIKMDITGLEDNRYNFFFMSKKDVEETLKYLYYLTDRQPEIQKEDI